MPEICDPLNWYEVRDACRRLKRHKAAGGDGLPPEFFKLLVKDKGERNNPSKPRSEMGKAYLHMVEMIYDTGDILAGASDAVIVSIPKKGDLPNTDNYRGIALISVAIKILTTVVTRRILRVLEKRKFFNLGQAGFCTGEECIGQVACLKEIVKLRHKEGKPTYAAYIDFKKAYDTVPHEALFLKLVAAGLQGRTLRFFQALYRSSSIKVRHMEQLSDSIPVQRGVRQGCPASPCLFNVYINDILDADGETWGLEIPNFFRKMKGLLFADDLVLLADSPESLQTSLDKVSEWAMTWSMKFGIDKCMVTGDLLDLTMRIFLLGGEMVPVGETYKYLGIDVDSNFSIERIVKERADKGRKSLHACHHLLANRAVPIWSRLIAFKACMYPVICYGAEIMGAHDQRSLHVLQRLVSTGMRILIGKGARSTSVGTATLHHEFNIPLVPAFCGGQRARAFDKYLSDSSTWIGYLVNKKPKNQPFKRWTWTTRTENWMNKYVPAAQFNSVRYHAWEKWDERHNCLALEPYKTAGYGQTRRYLLQLNRSMIVKRRDERLLVLARVGGLKLGDSWRSGRSVCPLCSQLEGRSLAHLMIVCPTLVELRRRWLNRFNSCFNDIDRPLDPKEMTVILLGGEARGKRIPYWVYRDPHSRNGIAGHVPVAKFLGEAVPKYLNALYRSMEG
ncbi:hypothetical protein L7F22_000582 [Adiantum nelumboides]|nr:hypothetical protein [Adiantum nelumboides]